MGVGARSSLWGSARALLLCGSAAVWALYPCAGLAHEAPNVSDEATGLRAFKSAKYHFEIPAGPLEDSLQLWAATAKLKVLAPANQVRHVSVDALSGAFTPEQALAKLLVATNLKYAMTGSQSVGVYDPTPANARAQAATLPTITVRGPRRRPTPRPAPPVVRIEPAETAYGPVRGYVATRSASGTKTDTPIIETPQSISVVARDQLEAQRVRTVSQALNYTAGVFAETRGSVNGLFEFPMIRGFVPAGFLYQDGMQLLGASAGMQIEPYALERIEVIKGPASVLYGQGSPSGVVNLISKRPTETPFREVQLQFGSFNRKQVNFDAGGPIDKDGKVLYRLTGIARDSDTQVDFTRDDRLFIAPALTFRPNLDTTLTILAQHQKANSGFFNFLNSRGTFQPNPNGMFPTNLYTGDPSFNRSEITHTGVGYLFEHRVNEIVTVRQNYRHMDLLVNQSLVFGTALAADGRTLTRNAFRNRDQFNADTVDNQVQFKFNTDILSHTVLMGLDWQRSTEEHPTGTLVGPGAGVPNLNLFAPVYYQSIPTPAFTAGTNQTARQTGWYAQDQLKLDRWVMLLGVRRDHATSTTYNLASRVTTAQSDEAVTKRVGLLYQFDNGVSPYVSYSESFTPQTGADFSGTPFKPTTGRQYEGGVKYQPKWLNTLFTVAAFDLVRQNVPTPDPAHPPFTIQTGEVTSRGVEVEAKVSLSRSLDVVAAYTYLDIEVTKSNGTDFGKHPVQVPRNSGAVWADYTFRNGPLSGFGAAVGVRFVGETWGNSINTIEVPSYTLVDAAVHYELGDLDPKFKGMKLAVNATNLFDKTYVASCLAAPTQCFYGLRRNVVGTLSYRW
jgi:iron complex outermembrane receptor protein